ncbi:nucleotidyltransferase family protein [Limoniibacter endophyticus]|uniref:4-diphosphocytidyl-2C-methyl-D-erythritol kinase n=1 Tax=Limoniibacter endophyticus TaxID=1565040 RepID=A0A8J3DSA4_9HYPH|nr:nucleotidyltransferase family protein [Limoniibacter endophyticus]GHC71882.1 4-diphosphocytidyl-2C-methyl-D-erythritol kinase [Limoniibacter endophyticus]
MTTVVLLAAGKSRRFGEKCKLRTPFMGKPLIRHAADAVVNTGLPRIAVVSDPAVQALIPEFRCIFSNGLMSQSLKAGIGALGDDDALIMLGDMPFVKSEFLLQIAGADTPAAATDGNKVSPPALIKSTLYPRLSALQGDQGAGSLLRELPGLMRFSAGPGELEDIDTGDDFAKFCEPTATKEH